MQDVGQNGPENEVNPLIDNGMMYTTDGWGTVYKIDIANPDQGKFVWIADAAVRHEGNSPRTRGIALWEDRVVANLPDGRVIAIDRDTACSPLLRTSFERIGLAASNEFTRPSPAGNASTAVTCRTCWSGGAVCCPTAFGTARDTVSGSTVA